MLNSHMVDHLKLTPFALCVGFQSTNDKPCPFTLTAMKYNSTIGMQYNSLELCNTYL